MGEFVLCRVNGGRRDLRLPGDGSKGATPVLSMEIDGALGAADAVPECEDGVPAFTLTGGMRGK